MGGQNKGGKRTSSAQLNERVHQTYQLLLDGADRASIMRYASETWGSSPRAVDNYMRLARVELFARRKEEREDMREEAVKRKLKLYRRALQSGRLDLALQIEQDLSKFRGLYPTEKIKHEGLEDLASFLLTGSKKNDDAGRISREDAPGS